MSKDNSDAKQCHVLVENLHLCSLKVSRPLTSGSAQLDQLLIWFSEKLLADLVKPGVGIDDRIELNRPHILVIGFPFEEDVESCSPRYVN